MTIFQALERAEVQNNENVGDLASGCARDALFHLIEHWRDVAQNWGEIPLSGRQFKSDFVGDIDDIITALSVFRRDLAELVANVPDEYGHDDKDVTLCWVVENDLGLFVTYWDGLSYVEIAGAVTGHPRYQFRTRDEAYAAARVANRNIPHGSVYYAHRLTRGGTTED